MKQAMEQSSAPDFSGQGPLAENFDRSAGGFPLAPGNLPHRDAESDRFQVPPRSVQPCNFPALEQDIQQLPDAGRWRH